ncbi:hypothetical protein PAXINDRAFT_88737 [Paxillus involutus ATCC 200175]|uniref:C2H2-type domain-containing protein n=1 Tax=Paxillus involutus ATCC 200175 TaxID=664439 RepID=A0A0C9TMM9_PAXIN|nr:hypothetical protein PAXINDRAFT_88737 [Paxillus involutus ATCC 200175]
MPEFRCPDCGKRFESTAQVERHRRQLHSSCQIKAGILVDPSRLLDLDLLRVHGIPECRARPIRRSYNPRRPTIESDDEVPEFDSDPLAPAPVKTVEFFNGASTAYDARGTTFMEAFNADQFTDIRNQENLYYPFVDRRDWEVGSFLLTSSLSMKAIDKFLSLDLIKSLPLSFRSARELRGLAELLPQLGPRWCCKTMETSCETKRPARLFYRDTVDCLAYLFSNPLFKDWLELSPYRVFETAERLVRVYSEWMSVGVAWGMQEELPDGATLLGAILSSDKTNITNMCGGRVAHPLLIGLANISSAIRNKASSNAFLLTALLPIVEFIHPVKRMQTLLTDRLYHDSVAFVVEPLKIAARIGIMLSDPAGNSQYCFTPLASCITDPNDLQAYFKACAKDRLNGVQKPFWDDWERSDPTNFLTPEPLHHWHREFYDHDIRWCMNAVGNAEIDFRFSIMQPITGQRHFAKGITTLKQVTRRVQRDLQHYIIGVIAGAAPAGVVRAVRALMDFHYLAQAPIINDDGCKAIQRTLSEFHRYKQSIIAAGARCGESGNVLEHWQIPKLELMQSVVPSIPDSGPAIQWTADTTERAHIDLIKDPASSTNNREYEAQICRALDRLEKCRGFELATRIREWERGMAPTAAADGDGSDDKIVYNTDSEDDDADSGLPLDGLTDNQQISNYFLKARQPGGGQELRPPRTFVNGPTAFQLNFDPAIGSAKIDDVAETYGLPDLRAALGDYLAHARAGQTFTVEGQRRSRQDVALPFERMQIWQKARIQQKLYHDGNVVLPPQTLVAHPAKRDWPHGRYDSVVVNVDDRFTWPNSGLKVHTVCELRLIFRLTPPPNQTPWWSNQFLTYVHRFDVVPHSANDGVDPITHLTKLKRAARAAGDAFGDVVPLSQICSFAHIIPQFGDTADVRFTPSNSAHYSTSFYLNCYFDKEFYYALTSTC